ncbi:Kazal-type serine protease inhibitor family protein [Dyadobacter sp.]|uniref:Kazal-type serine protease inhibitor family protein n=1 Tax=Dyadobacter sp. TaxID=1914288 RepID=UPI0038D3C1E1
MRTVLGFLLVLSLIACKKSSSPDPACVERARDSSGCYYVLAPVCGCNGKTYPNDCEARAHGITTFSQGECSKKN